MSSERIDRRGFLKVGFAAATSAFSAVYLAGGVEGANDALAPEYRDVDGVGRVMRVVKGGYVNLTSHDTELNWFLRMNQGRSFAFGNVPREFVLPLGRVVSRVTGELDVPPEIVWAILLAEHGFDKLKVETEVNAKSGAVGIHQVIAKTQAGWEAKEFEDGGLLDPELDFALDQGYVTANGGLGVDVRHLAWVVKGKYGSFEEKREAEEYFGRVHAVADPANADNGVGTIGIFMMSPWATEDTDGVYGIRGRWFMRDRGEVAEAALHEFAFKYSGGSESYADGVVDVECKIREDGLESVIGRLVSGVWRVWLPG